MGLQIWEQTLSEAEEKKKRGYNKISRQLRVRRLFLVDADADLFLPLTRREEEAGGEVKDKDKEKKKRYIYMGTDH